MATPRQKQVKKALKAEELVACPNCGSVELKEFAYRFTTQPVYGLRRDGEAEDYSSFDYGDDVFVCGYGCSACDWFDDSGDRLSPAVLKRMDVAVKKVLAKMPTAQ